MFDIVLIVTFLRTGFRCELFVDVGSCDSCEHWPWLGKLSDRSQGSRLTQKALLITPNVGAKIQTPPFAAWNCTSSPSRTASSSHSLGEHISLVAHSDHFSRIRDYLYDKINVLFLGQSHPPPNAALSTPIDRKTEA